jgi:hypothetical protein
MPGEKNVFTDSSQRLAQWTRSSPIPGTDRRKSFTSSLSFRKKGLVSFRLMNELSAPTFSEMLMLLSLSTTMRFLPRIPAWLSPSKAIPAVRAASPRMATTFSSPPRSRIPSAAPRAAEIAVPAWPAPKTS